ncbi:MAG: hypothetical protein O7G85_07920, partial [Planctomycetota bacterium]|nr:hypothetical protein [Planctomycetota bacterium]
MSMIEHDPKPRRRVTRSYVMTIEASPEGAFVYFCPQREHEYLQDWKAQILFSESGFAEPGCIFQTNRPDDPAPTTWVIHAHDPRKLEVHFVMVTPESRVGRLSVICRPLEDQVDRCHVTFTYEMTPIAAHGERFLEEVFTADSFA